LIRAWQKGMEGARREPRRLKPLGGVGLDVRKSDA
jgi:hypothetical protein